MTKIESCVSFSANGKINTVIHSFKTKDKNVVFNHLISDAVIFADSKNGKVYIDRTETSLYIDYCDIPGTNCIDRLYRIAN